MPELASALFLRFFGTRRLALTSGLWLAGTAWVVVSLPSVMVFAAKALFTYVGIVGGLTMMGLIMYIIPGIFIALVGAWFGCFLVVLLVRGYWNLGIRCYNWLYTTYSLAREDVALNALFENVDFHELPTSEQELARLRSQLADKDALIASQQAAIASFETTISRLRDGQPDRAA